MNEREKLSYRGLVILAALVAIIVVLGAACASQLSARHQEQLDHVSCRAAALAPYLPAAIDAHRLVVDGIAGRLNIIDVMVGAGVTQRQIDEAILAWDRCNPVQVIAADAGS